MRNTKFISVDTVPFLFVMIVWAIYTLVIFIGGETNDDLWFHRMWRDYTAVDYVSMRYTTWSARIVPDLMTFVGSHYRLAMILFNYIGLAIFYCMFQQLLGLKTLKQKLILSWLFCIFPFYTLCHAGYAATTANYLWPLIGVTGILFVYKKLTLGEYSIFRAIVVTVPFVVLIFFVEQALAMTMVLSLLISTYSWVRHKLLDRYMFSISIVCAFGMVFVLTAPGNSLRLETEIQNCMPSYPEISIWDKISLGLIQLNHVCLATRNLYTMIFSLLVFCLFMATRKTSNVIIKISGILPLLINVGYILRGSLFVRHVAEVLPSSFGIMQYFEIATIILYFGCSLYFIVFSRLFDNGFLLSCILVVGCMTQAMMGMSPTVYASGIRTSIYLQFCLLFVIAEIVKVHNVRIVKNRILIYAILGFMVLLCVSTESFYILRDTNLL